MAFLLYLIAASLLLWISHRALVPLSRWAVIALLLLPLCVTGKALLTGGVFGPVDLPYFTEPLRDMRVPLGVPQPHNGMLSDLYAQMIPWRKAVQFALAHGQWPLWNPFILSGTQLAASAQPAAYSPFTLIACLLPVAQSITFTAALTFFLAGLGAFLFARELECRESVALSAAAGWMYAGPMAFFVLWSLGNSWALFPLVLFATRRSVHLPGIRSTAILSTTLALLLLAGHPETAFHIVFCGSLYAIVEMLVLRRNIVRPLASALAAGVIALLLCAIYILPIFEAAPQTMEQQFRTGGYLDVPRGVGGVESGARILTDLFPHLHGRYWNWKDPHWVPLETSAVGSILLALAAYAIIRVRRREVAFFAALALFGILARAAWAPLAAALQKLPLFDITLNERFCFAAAFSLVILGALGLEHALRRRDRALFYTLAAAMLFFAAGAFTINRLNIMAHSLPEWGVYTLFGELTCLGVGAILIAILWSRDRTTAPATEQTSNRTAFATTTAILILIVIQRWQAGNDIYPTLPAFAAYPPVPILRSLPRETGEPFRIVGRAHALVPGTSALYELEDARGYEALTFSRYVATYDAWCKHQPVWFNRVDDLTKPFLSMLNVRYAIASDKLPAPDGWRSVAVQRGAELLENTRVLPRAFVPERAVFGTSFDGTLDAMKAATDFRQRAWIEAPLAAGERGNAGCTVASVRRDDGDLIVEAATSAGGWVVITEPAWDGWRVYIDGRRVQHFYANVAFLGVFVPPGGHTIRLTYLPESFVRGRAISFSTLALLLGGGVFARLRRRRSLKPV
ncbi:MAG TPA: YfhO family protein [Thermoanaerobaculia bacterium]|nr:YfhO family protein [Thermoanaerobaculia bacterium]